tara:strand:+ start:11574 stop:12341 length:768 start_codon:yes stop_codon:yes gene_type:complete
LKILSEHKFSIITVCFNSEITIEQTIRSVLSQSYKNLEYIIVDGGSTDGTLEIINRYKNKIDILICEPDNGIYDAMNKGINSSSGELIGLLNSDDWYEPDTLELVSEAYKESDRQTVIHGLCKEIDQNREGKIHAYHHDVLPVHSIAHPTCFVPKSIYDKYGIYDIDFKIAADYEFLLRLYLNGVGFKRIERVLVNFRTDGASNNLASGYEDLAIRYRHEQFGRVKYMLKWVKYSLFYLKHLMVTRPYQKWVLGR